MPLEERRRNTAKAADTSWISIHVTHEGQPIPRKPGSQQSGSPRLQEYASADGRLFRNAAEHPITFSERFPRLTVAAIAVALVAFTVVTEIEYLRVAGYDWR
jgi:hypothetical protein